MDQEWEDTEDFGEEEEEEEKSKHRHGDVEGEEDLKDE